MFIDIHTHKRSNSGINIPTLFSYEYPDISTKFCSLGIYPFSVDRVTDIDLRELDKLADTPNVAAIGETGLDYRVQYRDSMARQKDVFNTQIQIAMRLSKPLIIHQVRAFEDIMAMLRGVNVPIIFHGFTGSAQMAQRIVERGYYMGFGQIMIYNRRISELFAELPTKNIFLETDDSQLSIEQIYEYAANVKGVTCEQLQEMIEQNFYDTGMDAAYRAAVG